MDTKDPSLETLQDIKRIMERSSRFISLSGLSGMSAGVCGLLGAYLAKSWIGKYTVQNEMKGDIVTEDAHDLTWKLVVLASGVLIFALIFSFYFTWRKARKNNLPVWDHSSKKLLVNLLIPLLTGGLFVLGLLYHDQWKFVAPACLVFYGLALVNASKYTLSDIRVVGILEIVLGLINMYLTKYGLYFWAIGFGILHIIYGWIMWLKYER
jgi:heme/copper-type cytochrome/quinol oxidase subunit 3